MADKICESCLKEYPIGTRNRRQYAESRFCSRECFGQYLSKAADEERAKQTKTCRQCGKVYSPGYNQRAAFEESRYCSRECSNNRNRRSIDKIFALIRIDPVTGCHEWQGYRNKGGYGRTRLMGTRQLVHRIVWEHKNGPVPDGLELDHICRNTSCCNPEHLRAVTSKVNSLAGVNPCAENARKTHCPKCGGEYDRVNKRGARYCRACLNKRTAEYVRRRCAEDPEYRQRRNEATYRFAEGRYLTDPKFKAMRDANNKKHREKLKQEKESNESRF